MDVPSVKKPGILLSDLILTISLPSSLSLFLAHTHTHSLSRFLLLHRWMSTAHFNVFLSHGKDGNKV